MRLVDIDSLKGCSIIRPTSSEEIAHIEACKGWIAHKDIPTAYDVEAVVAELEADLKISESDYEKTKSIFDLGNQFGLRNAISIVRGKE